MKVDLHVHTRDWSDGRASAENMIQRAIAAGMDGIAISDHNRMLQRDEQSALKARFPGFQVFRGGEYTCGNDHINVVGGNADVYSLPTPETIGTFGCAAAESGAFTFLSHPYRLEDRFSFDLETWCPEGMDILSLNINTAHLRTFMRLAEEHGMRRVACSDAHKLEHVGVFHLDFDHAVTDEEALVDELRAGRYYIAVLEDFWAERVTETTEAEAVSRAVLQQGGGIEEYRKRTTYAECFFDRFCKGGSFVPPREVVGLRGDAFAGGQA